MMTSELVAQMADRLVKGLDELDEDDTTTTTVSVTARIPGVGRAVLTFETLVDDDEQAGE